eukprot:CAMPEP_0184661166 /NCGR_PEP_ID=MMETSP0308-20130426/37209_1 /TAXON_ID=38269 /ORGANISM="Gloeochaete witrockiana, Strain SAG 46.84" /LENGTH=270 /DNA_ID=CAMNT_0027102275 /DNA_START=202 /DNA_END=1011 /DNA_ORIENTATION=+
MCKGAERMCKVSAAQGYRAKYGTTPNEKNRDMQKFDEELKEMRERERRTFLRKLEKGKDTSKVPRRRVVGEDEDSDSDESDDDEDEEDEDEDGEDESDEEDGADKGAKKKTKHKGGPAKATKGVADDEEDSDDEEEDSDDEEEDSDAKEEGEQVRGPELGKRREVFKPGRGPLEASLLLSAARSGVSKNSPGGGSSSKGAAASSDVVKGVPVGQLLKSEESSSQGLRIKALKDGPIVGLSNNSKSSLSSDVANKRSSSSSIVTGLRGETA